MKRKHTETDRRSSDRDGFDVYAAAILGMLGVGILLVPVLLASASGALVILAAICGAVIVVPTLLSLSELSTAMPRSGGAYVFVDRSLGPAAGWTAGAASWVIFVLECAFIFAGVGLLAAAFFEIPATAVAVGLAVAIGVVQLVRLRRWTLPGRVAAGLLTGRSRSSSSPVWRERYRCTVVSSHGSSRRPLCCQPRTGCRWPRRSSSCAFRASSVSGASQSASPRPSEVCRAGSCWRSA